MSQEQMTQSEIDALMRNISDGDIDDPSIIALGGSLDPIEAKNRYNAVAAAKKRYEWAMQNSSFDEAEQARRNMHRAAFGNWLFRHGMRRDDYYKLVNREAASRGLRPPFRID